MATLLETYFSEYDAPDYTEPKRKNASLSGKDIGLHKNEGYHNILALIRRGKLSRAELDYWGDWYVTANNEARRLADEFDLPLPVVSAVIAVLSPGAKWKQNLISASKVIENWLHAGAPDVFPKYNEKIAAYGANVRKAMKILETGDTSIVSGPKVSVFFNSVNDPSSIPDGVVLDGHAINIWRGHKIGIKGLKSPTKEERKAMIQDYTKVADILGLSPQAVQAISWYIWKSVYDAPPPPSIQIPVEQPQEKAMSEGLIRLSYLL